MNLYSNVILFFNLASVEFNLNLDWIGLDWIEFEFEFGLDWIELNLNLDWI